MDLRDPAIIVPSAVGAGFFFLPGRGLMLPATLFGPAHWGLIIPMALVIFCVVYFGVLAFWKLLTAKGSGSRFPPFWLYFSLSD